VFSLSLAYLVSLLFLACVCVCCVFQVIWPYNTGEVIVQNYNAVLSLAHLHQSADAIIALENDVLHAVCTRLLAIPKVSFYNLNRVIARQLASILTPVYAENGRTLVRNQLGEFANVHIKVLQILQQILDTLRIKLSVVSQTNFNSNVLRVLMSSGLCGLGCPECAQVIC
jgi:Tubulin/FtsZ family, GTPase domain